MKLWLWLCFICGSFATNNYLADVNLIDCIINILTYKNIKFVKLLTCVNIHDKVRISKTFSHNNIRHSFISNTEHTDFTQLGFVFDTSCENFTNIFKKSQKLNLFQSHLKWILFDSQNNTMRNLSSITNILYDTHFRLDSDISVVFTSNYTTKIFIFDVYTIWKTNVVQTKITEIGYWTPSLKLNITNKNTKYVQRKNLTGTFLKVGTVKTQPLNNETLHSAYRNRAKKDADTLNKVNYMLFIHLQEMHNFTYNMTVTDEWFGNVVGGIDSGLGKLLHKGLVDIGATSGSVRTDRIKFLDYVFPTYPFKTCFIFRMPRSTKEMGNEFLKPFVYSLWYLTLAATVVFCAFLKFLFFIEYKIFGKPKNNSWHSAWILTMGVFCQQGAAFVPKPISGRCILINMLTMSLLLYNYYTSSIVSSLLSNLPTPFKTITELTESQLNVGLEDITYIRRYFEVSTDIDLNKFYTKKVLVNNIPSYVPVKEGIKRVKAGGYAYHTEANTGYTIINTEFEPYQICELGEVNVLPPQMLWVFYKKNSEYSKIFAIGYNQMLQSGITSRQQSIWMTKKHDCLANTHLIQVDMQHLLPAFFILGVGAAAALLLLLIEIIVLKILK